MTTETPKTENGRNRARRVSPALAASLALSVGAMATIAMPAGAWAEQSCAPRAQVIEKLGKEYGEAPVAIGLGADGNVVEVLSSATGSTFTIVVTTASGVSCLATHGEAWQAVPRLVLGQAS